MNPILIAVVTASVGTPSHDVFIEEGYNKGQQVSFVAMKMPFRESDNDECVMELSTATAFSRMKVAAELDGHHLEVNSAHRTHSEQIMFRRRFGDIAAKPGFSNHQSGLSVDIAGTMMFIPYEDINMEHFSPEHCIDLPTQKGAKCKTVLYWWLKRNAKKFGFVDDVEEEPWHWTYEKGNTVERTLFTNET